MLWPGETAWQQQTAVPFLTSSSSSYTLQCGKTPEVAGLQDLLVYTLKGLGALAVKARAAGIVDDQVNSFIMRAMFSTLTYVLACCCTRAAALMLHPLQLMLGLCCLCRSNVNFSDERFKVKSSVCNVGWVTDVKAWIC